MSRTSRLRWQIRAFFFPAHTPGQSRERNLQLSFRRDDIPAFVLAAPSGECRRRISLLLYFRCRLMFGSTTSSSEARPSESARHVRVYACPSEMELWPEVPSKARLAGASMTPGLWYRQRCPIGYATAASRLTPSRSFGSPRVRLGPMGPAAAEIGLLQSEAFDSVCNRCMTDGASATIHHRGLPVRSSGPRHEGSCRLCWRADKCDCCRHVCV